jgi:hypothetical protein
MKTLVATILTRLLANVVSVLWIKNSLDKTVDTRGEESGVSALEANSAEDDGRVVWTS